MSARSTPVLGAFLALAVVTLMLVGCGGGGAKLPQQAAVALVRDLDKIDQNVRSGDCKAARPKLRRLQGRVGALPQNVDSEVKTTLGDGVGQLGNLVKSQCKQRPPKRKKAPKPQIVTPEPVAPQPTTPTYEPTPAPEPQPQPQPETPKQEKPRKDAPKQSEPTPQKPAESKPSDGGGSEGPPKGGGSPSCPPDAPSTC